MNVAIIGAGAVGTNLANVFFKKGVNVVQIITRDVEHGKSIADSCKAVYTQNPGVLLKSVTHVFLTVPDQVIPELASRLSKGGYCLLHTSGSTHIDLLRKHADNVGVFYPLQSFDRDQAPNWSEIPIFIEASNQSLENQLIDLGTKIGESATLLDSKSRSLVHLSAVFACNFSNYMVSIAQDLVKSAGQSGDILIPLLQETISRAVKVGAKASQTGPAKRGDFDTIKKHLDLLSFREDDRAVYKLLSDSLMKKYMH